MACIVLLGGQPCSQYRIAWKSLLSQHFNGLRVFDVNLEEKEGFSSVAMRENPNAIHWEKLELKFQKFKELYASQSSHNECADNISHLLVCSDERIASAPGKILHQADLVLVTFANEEDTFRNLILQRKILVNIVIFFGLEV